MVLFFRPSPLELAQQGHARSRLDFDIGSVVQERLMQGVTVVAADVRSPQVFVSHPVIATSIDSTAAGIDTALPSLPGRPPAGWDGEPGVGSPMSGAL